MSNASSGGPPGDRTIIKPRPGAGRQAGPASAAPPSAPVPPQPPGASAGLGGSAGAGASLAEVPRIEFAEAGLDPLFHAAGPLLLLAGRLRHSTQAADTAHLRQQLVREVRAFEEKARNAGVPADQIAAARYALCATLDEAILSTPWGSSSDWSSQPLLVIFHRETWGGEKFFQLLERTQSDPGQYAGLLEVLYSCLSLGFAGKFALAPQGQMQRDRLQHELYERIRSVRGQPPAALSEHWEGVQDRTNPLLSFVPLWVVAAAGLAILAGAYLYFRAQLANRAEPVYAALAQAGVQDFTAAAPAPAVAPATTLKRLLADLEQQGRVDVEEDGARSTVTVLGTDLFASGSARISPQYQSTLAAIAAALNELPGPVLVVGHTDDQPIRSFKYQNNYELSADRAAAVVSELEATLDEPARLRSTGVGSSQPRYLPPETAENRARNRRVEIVHVASGTAAP
jgi:type VI secretion system protein ImpK